MGGLQLKGDLVTHSRQKGIFDFEMHMNHLGVNSWLAEIVQFSLPTTV